MQIGVFAGVAAIFDPVIFAADVANKCWTAIVRRATARLVP